jgi:TrmH family RNA methyltransferase
MKYISSTQNPEIKLITKLLDAKQRYKRGLFLAEGIRTCSTLAQSGIKLQQVYVIEEKIKEALEWCNADKITIITQPILKKISQSITPSGVVGVFHIPILSTSVDTGIVLAQIADPGNMGTLIRTCAALGKKTVIVVEGADPWNIKVVQASAGTIGMVNIHSLSWQELINKNGNRPLAALVIKDGIHPKKIDLSRALLVIGNEAHGLPTAWLRDCDHKITLPMPGNIESLNAAIAGSIVMYLAWSK